MTITLILLAFWAVCSFAAFRWTQGLPVWLRRLTRSFLLALLCPNVVVQEDGVPFGPLFIFLTFGQPGLKPEEVKWIIIQALIAWGVIYGFWMIFGVLPKLDLENPAKRRRVRLIAIACSFVSWIAIGVLVNYWVNVHQEYQPLLFDWFIVIFFIFSLICALVSMTLVLFSISEHRTIPSDVFWTLWATCPAVVVMFLGIWVWFQTD